MKTENRTLVIKKIIDCDEELQNLFRNINEINADEVAWIYAEVFNRAEKYHNVIFDENEITKKTQRIVRAIAILSEEFSKSLIEDFRRTARPELGGIRSW